MTHSKTAAEATDALAIDVARARALLDRALAPEAATAQVAEPGCALPALRDISRAFRLSPFERDVLLLALAIEVDVACAQRIEKLRGLPDRRHLTVGIALAALADQSGARHAAALAALLPDAHLARSGLIEVGADGPHVTRELRIPASLWPRLAGLPATPPFQIVRSAGGLAALVVSESTRAAADIAVAAQRRRAPSEVAVGVRGRPGDGRKSVALAIADALGFPAMIIAAAVVDDEARSRAVVREAGWCPAAVVLVGPPSPAAAAHLAGDLSTPLLVVLDAHDSSRALMATRPAYTEVEVGALDTASRRTLWWRRLSRLPLTDEVDVAALAAHHQVGAGTIATICSMIEEQLVPGASVRPGDVATARRRLAGSMASSLARRLDCPYGWDDLVLAPATARELRLVRAWVRHGGSFHGSAPNMVCLFAGPPGTGKTMAAQVIARELERELLRIDLSQVVNKYIGETEKNLDRVFAMAEASGAVLFFDEADALFARRTDVKEAQDRYANLETAFLLQRIEVHHGLVLMASNLRKNFDEAFVRRIHVIADFPIPEPPERRRIWEGQLAPAQTADDLDVDGLARQFAITGGDIRNAVATARLLAADEDAAIAHRHLAIALWRELSKSGRIVSPDDFGTMSGEVRRYLGVS